MKSKTMLNVLAVFLALGMLVCLIPSDVTAGNGDLRRGALIKDAVLDEINKNSVNTNWVGSQKDQTDTSQDNKLGVASSQTAVLKELPICTVTLFTPN